MIGAQLPDCGGIDWQVETLLEQYRQWDTSDDVCCIVLKGSGPKVRPMPSLAIPCHVLSLHSLQPPEHGSFPCAESSAAPGTW